ncbi:MAG: STAS domain-containing protein [Elusimicrobiaceae bacterium]|nr:STAS domain-containing protein [Elusimicrobiaceae bacterium]
MIQFKTQNGKLVCTFPSRVETTVCQQYQHDVENEVLASSGPVVFDLRDTEYICSAFLRICLAAVQKLGKDRFEVVNTAPFVQKVFHLAGLDSLVKLS